MSALSASKLAPSAALQDLNLVVVCGHLSSDPVVRELPSGDHLVQYEVSAVFPDATVSTPVVQFGERPRTVPKAGENVAVLGVVRRRFYRVGGSTHSRTEVVATRLVFGNDKRRRKALFAAAVRDLALDR